MAPNATVANRRARPFDRGTSGRQGIGQGSGRIAQDGVGLEDESGRGNCHGCWRARCPGTASGSRRAARRAGRAGALARPLLLTIAMSPLLTISAGRKSIEKPPADDHSARRTAAAIHPNRQHEESNFWRRRRRSGRKECGDAAGQRSTGCRRPHPVPRPDHSFGWSVFSMPAGGRPIRLRGR